MERRNTWFSKLGRTKEEYEEERRRRFEQIVNGQAVVVGQASDCKIIRKSTKLETPKVKPEEKLKVLLPSKREIRKKSYHYESYIRGNRKVGRRRVTVRIPLDLHEQLSHMFHLEKHFIYHARTSERVEPTSILERKRPSFATDTITVYNTEDNLELKAKFPRKVALVMPTQAYHRRKNQKLSPKFKFIVKDGKIQAMKFNSATESWKPCDNSEVKYRKTSQWKSVWFTRRSRRK